MGIFTQRVFIPRPLYAWIPIIYLVTGILMWLVFSHPLIKLVALFLIAFSVYITAKRFSSSSTTGKARTRRRVTRTR
jgi:membrane protein implicated in regulation of membrane protease activity